MFGLIKTSIQRSFRALGFEVLRSKSAHLEPEIIKNLLRASGADTLLDVGANVGQYGSHVFEGGFKGKIISFEAISAAHAELSKLAKKYGDAWQVGPCVALGSKNGTVEFNVAGNSVSSSVLPMKQAHLHYAPQSRYVRREEVTMSRLDEVAPSLIPPGARLMIKIDTQGYELEVLKGALGLLPQTVALQMELSLMPLYEAAPTLAEMIAYTESLGFEMFSIVPSFWDAASGRSLQVDGFFIGKEAISRQN